jgi:hypothetical protein
MVLRSASVSVTPLSSGCRGYCATGQAVLTPSAPCRFVFCTSAEARALPGMPHSGVQPAGLLACRPGELQGAAPVTTTFPVVSLSPIMLRLAP